MKKNLMNIIILFSLLLSACSSVIPTAEEVSVVEESLVITPVVETVTEEVENAEEVENDEELARPANWSYETHSNDAEPNYEVVFPDDKVNQITITISPENWALMQDNMVSLFGEPGSVDASGNFAGGGQPPQGELPNVAGNGQPPQGELPQGGVPPQNGERPAMPAEGERPDVPAGDLGGGLAGRMGGGNMTTENPMWVEATIEFEGNIWTHVGVRYKGNSSLTSGWRTGSDKLPFKLDFDEFEDEYPEITDQRFYGFKQLSLSNAYKDSSLMRDAVAAQIYADAGLPVAETAFYEVILDYGEGPVSLGLYTMIEVIDDTVIERYFGDDEGNIYDADGPAASFAASTYDQIEASFEKENNKDSDWSDIEALFNTLHSDLRTTDPAAWRSALEAQFDVDSFLEWLAISAVIEHWDAYGNMTHNYYLYNNPETGQITWITWDHNETLSSTAAGGNRSVSLDKAEITDNWPLIRYLLDAPIYYEKYTNYLAETITGPFEADKMTETYQNIAALIAPYAAKDVGEAAFNNAVQELIEYSYERAEAVETFLSNLDN